MATTGGGRAWPKLGVRIPPCESIDRVADAIALAEQLGFDSAWAPDFQLIWRDTFMALALAATRTQSITLATAVTNLVTRHTTTVASATRTLQELAPGRVVLGVGVGRSSTGMAGLERMGFAAFARELAALRSLLAGESVRWGETAGRLTAPVGPCPVDLCAQGPKMLRYAGTTADGVITPNGLAPGLLEERLRLLSEGAAAGGRRMADLDVVAWAPAHVTDDLRRDLRLLKPAVAVFLRAQPTEELAAAGIHERLAGPLPPGFEPDGLHIADWNRAVEGCDAIVADALALRWIDAFALVGSSADLGDRLAGIATRGVCTLVVSPLVGDNSQSLPTRLMRELSSALALAG